MYEAAQTTVRDTVVENAVQTSLGGTASVEGRHDIAVTDSRANSRAGRDREFPGVERSRCGGQLLRTKATEGGGG